MDDWAAAAGEDGGGGDGESDDGTCERRGEIVASVRHRSDVVLYDQAGASATTAASTSPTSATRWNGP